MIFFNEEQFSNVFLSIVLTEEEMKANKSDLHFENANLPILLIEDGIIICSNDMQL